MLFINLTMFVLEFANELSTIFKVVFKLYEISDPSFSSVCSETKVLVVHLALYWCLVVLANCVYESLTAL